jgi:hypothetical protein
MESQVPAEEDAPDEKQMCDVLSQAEFQCRPERIHSAGRREDPRSGR